MSLQHLAVLLAALPLATGPLPQEARTITVGSCLGGLVEIPVGGDDDLPPSGAKACHAASCRKRFDLAQ